MRDSSSLGWRPGGKEERRRGNGIREGHMGDKFVSVVLLEARWWVQGIYYGIF